MIKLVSIGEVFEFVRNGASIKQDDNKSGYPITRIETIWNETIDYNRFGFADVFDNELEKYEKYLLEVGDILMTHINSPKHLGKSALYNGFPEKLLHGMNLLCLRPKKEISNSIYLKHYLNSPYFKGLLPKISNQSVNQASFSAGNLKSLKIPLPSLIQQQKIANILDAADELRQNDKALLAKYDELAHSLFLDMFGDPVGNPKGWKVNKLKEISTKIHSGNTPKGGSEVYVEEGITFFRSQNVWKNRLVYEDIAFIDQATHDKMMKSSLKHKDILMTKTGRINTENSSLGRAAMYLGEDDEANVNGHVYLIRLKKGIINEFVLHILTTKEYRGHIRSVCVGGIDKRQLNKDHIENFPIINPPIELQNKFTEQLAIIEQQKAITQKSLIKSEELFNSLLQKAFKGEL